MPRLTTNSKLKTIVQFIAKLRLKQLMMMILNLNGKQFISAFLFKVLHAIVSSNSKSIQGFQQSWTWEIVIAALSLGFPSLTISTSILGGRVGASARSLRYSPTFLTARGPRAPLRPTSVVTLHLLNIRSSVCFIIANCR